MISRTYVVKMPEATSTTPFDIVVQGPVGSSATGASSASTPGVQPTVAVSVANGNAPAGAWGTNNDGSYYEIRARPFRVPVLAGGAPPTAAQIALGFVPRLRLGLTLSVVPLATAIQTDVPGVQLSSSLVPALSITGLAVPALADPSYGPVIRLTGGANTAGKFYLVTLAIMEAKDEDRNAAGV
jgi:hypothetical protein